MSSQFYSFIIFSAVHGKSALNSVICDILSVYID